jgi:hypothetical protein
VRGQPYDFFRLALSSGDGSPNLFLGAPAITSAALEQVVRSFHLGSVGIFAFGKLVSSAGSSRLPLMAGHKLAPPHGTAQLDAASEAAAQPFPTRFLDPRHKPSWLVARKAIEGGPLELSSAAPLEDAVHAAWHGELLVLACMAAALALLAAVLKMSGSSAGPGRAFSLPVATPSPARGLKPNANALPLAVKEAEPEAPSADDAFPQFGAPAAQASEAGEVSDGQGFSDMPPLVADPGGLDSHDGEATRVLPTAGELVLDAVRSADPDDEGATRVMQVRPDLLEASGLAAPAGEPRRSNPALPAAVAPSVAAFDESRHMQEVFQEFLATRERCGEPAEGLSFDKFALKLKKNQEQLVAKLNCRAVRFQVYVKEGRAAIKASPVRD